MPAASEHVALIREFNRFYTARLGLLGKRHLGGEFSLTEARTLYEIGSHPGTTATQLCSTLGIDAGYLSRVLRSLARRKLLRQEASKSDGRERLLTLTASGGHSLAHLNSKSDRQVEQLLEDIDSRRHSTLIHALAEARRILEAPRGGGVVISRISGLCEQALQILDEYYEAVHVVQRDTPDEIRSLISDPASGMWLARLEGNVAGCAVLRHMSTIPHAAEVKRMYVRPEARCRHVASLLLDELEAHARARKFEWIYLDTYDDLKPAIALYEKRGYSRCHRYNENPQATVFMRKRL
jgi:DNA-binding MarR family transcriptional regulator/GNAT superfamily N-acetyltransferase